MKWKPFKSGTPYTCKDCPAYAEIQAERDRWRRIASQLVLAAEYSPCVVMERFNNQVITEEEGK